MREYLKNIEYKEINDSVNYKKSLSDTITSEKEIPIVFNKIENFNTRAIAGIVSSRELLAKSVNVNPLELADFVGKSLDNPLNPTLVNSAPFLHTHIKNPDLGSLIPIPVFYGDKRYLTASIVIANDPVTGRRNASIHRMMYIEKNRFAIRPIPQRHLHSFYMQALDSGKDYLDIAVVLGVHPAMELAAATSYPDLDEVAFAARMIGKMDVYDLDGIVVPANTEIVLRGRMLREEVQEGPFVDLTGTEDIIRMQPVVEITDLYMRENPLTRIILPGRKEHKMLMGIPQEPRMKKLIKNTIPTVKNVVMTEGGGSWLHAVVQIKKRTPGDGKNTILAALAAHPSLKRVVVIDEDVDPTDPVDVEWAIATRCQPDKNILLVPGAKGSSLDPSADENGTTCKWGIDATKPLGEKGYDRIY
jgi:UbiD family decarboxylase